MKLTVVFMFITLALCCYSASALLEPILSLPTGVLNTASGVVSDTVPGVLNTASGVVSDTVPGVVSPVINVTADTLKDLLGGVQDLISKLLSAINRLTVLLNIVG